MKRQSTDEADLFNGYKTFVSLPDDDRNEVQDGGHIKDVQHLYQNPRKFDRIRPTDWKDKSFEMTPGHGNLMWKDPSRIETTTDNYRDTMVDSVISQYFCEQGPFVIAGLSSHINRYAVKMTDLLNGVAPDIKERARQCRVELKRSMPKSNKYIFTVHSQGGSGPHVVTVKAAAGDRRVKTLDKADLKLACSCDYWIFYGPEYHARRGGYLDGKAKGTATPPRIRDPKGHNLLCKHVLATFDVLKNYPYRWRDDDDEKVEKSEAEGKKPEKPLVPTKKKVEPKEPREDLKVKDDVVDKEKEEVDTEVQEKEDAKQKVKEDAELKKLEEADAAAEAKEEAKALALEKAKAKEEERIRKKDEAEAKRKERIQKHKEEIEKKKEDAKRKKEEDTAEVETDKSIDKGTNL